MKLSQYFDMKLDGELKWPYLNFMSSGGKPILETKDIEKSILTQVSLKKTVEYYTHLDMEVEFQGQTYSTALLWDDEILLRTLYEMFKKNCGKSLKDIGNSEFPS